MLGDATPVPAAWYRQYPRASQLAGGRQVYQSLESDLDASRRKAVDLMLASFSQDDFREGVLSHLERRPPNFPPLDPDTV